MIYTKISAKEFRDTFLNGSRIIEYTMDYLQSRNVINFDPIIALYFSSIGSHILNLLNIGCTDTCQFHEKTTCKRWGLESKNKFFLMRNGQIPDLRSNILLIAPPGFSKDFFIDFFVNESYGFLSTVMPATKITRMTEAGYIGTKDKINNIYVPVYGLAKKYCAGIIALSEFFAISVEGKIEYSSQIENSLLSTLDKGEVDKILGAIEIKYKTYHTLWAATQPGVRLNISSGLGRRLNFYFVNPTDKLEHEMINAQKAGVGKSVDFSKIEIIRGYLQKMWSVREIKKVNFTEEYYDFRKTLPYVVHSDFNLYDNVALGYNFIQNYNDNEELNIVVDDLLKRVLKKIAMDRVLISKQNYTEWSILLSDISDKLWTEYALIRHTADKQRLSYSDAKEKVNDAINEGILGFFITRRKHGGYFRVVYNPKYYKSLDDAKRKWEETQN